MNTDTIDIRDDLLDVEDEVRRILDLSVTFSDVGNTFKKLINMQEVAKLGDPKFEAMAEELVSKGVDTAGTLAGALARINDPDYYPRVSDFVRAIREYQEAWLERDSVLINQCKAYAVKNRTDCLAQAVQAHEFVLGQLEKGDLESALEAIENSDLFKREARE